MTDIVSTQPFQEYDGSVTFQSSSSPAQGYFYDPFGPIASNAVQSTEYSVAGTTTAVYGQDYQLRLYDQMVTDLSTSSAAYTLLPPSGVINPSTVKYLYIVGLPSSSPGTKILDINFNTKYDLTSSATLHYITYYPELAHGTITTKGSLPDISPFRVLVGGQSFTLDQDGVTARGTGTIALGRSDGTFPLLTALAAQGRYTKDNISIQSTAFSASVGGHSESLWGGSMVVDVATKRGTISDDNQSGSFKLAGGAVNFSGVSIDPNSLAFDATIDVGVFPTIDTVKAGAPITFDSGGIHFGANNQLAYHYANRFKLGSLGDVIDANLAIKYNNAQNSLDATGSFTLEHFVSFFQPSVTVAGDSLVSITANGVAAKGTISVESMGLELYKLADVALAVTDTAVSGSATLAFPNPFDPAAAPWFKATGTLFIIKGPDGAVLDGFTASGAPDSFAFEIPDKPKVLSIKNFGLSVSNLSLGLYHAELSVNLTADIEKLKLGGGSNTASTSLVQVSSTLTGNLAEHLLSGSGNVKIGATTLKLFGSDIINSTFAEGTNTVVFDMFTGMPRSFEGTFNLLSGLAVWSGKVGVSPAGDINASGKVDFGVAPLTVAIPLFMGVPLENAGFVLNISNDGDDSNDFVAFYKTVGDGILFDQ